MAGSAWMGDIGKIFEFPTVLGTLRLARALRGFLSLKQKGAGNENASPYLWITKVGLSLLRATTCQRADQPASTSTKRGASLMW